MDLPVSCRLIFLIMLMTIMLPISATVQSHRNVTLGSVLTVGETNSSWLSPSGDFAFGFRQVSPGGYLLAIVFIKTPNRAIAWSANGGNVAGIGSKLQLSEDGLKLSGPNGQHIWAANLSGSGVAYGAMLDTGNFLLARNDAKVMWQTFNEPTDTLLPGQVLNPNGALFSSFSETNHSRGRFKFIMQTDSNLVLYPVDYPSTDIGHAYWASNTVNAKKYRAIFDESGYLRVVDENGTTIMSVFPKKPVSASEFYQRLTLDHDGVLRHYVYRKSVNSTNDHVWSLHDFIPSDICTAVVGDNGVGVCGYNSVCNLRTDDQKPYCICPKGYTLSDPTDRMGGCTPNFTRQSCNQRSDGGFQLVEMNSVEWVGLHYKHFPSVSEEWCSQSCLDDCYCDAAYFRKGECWKSSMPLMYGRVDNDGGGKTLLKIA